MNKISRLITTISQTIMIALLAGLPLFFLPFTQDFYDTNKWLLLVGTAAIVLLLTGLNAALTRTVLVTVSPLSLGFAGLTIAALVSLFVASPNRVEAMLLPIGVATFLNLTVVTLLASHTIRGKAATMLRSLLLISASIAGAVAMLQFFDIGKVLFPSVPFLSDPLWNPIGSSVALLVYLALLLPLAINGLRHGLGKSPAASLAHGIATVLLVTGIVVTLIRFVPLMSRVLMPLSAGWAVTLEVMKNPRQAALGVGLENFIAAYTTGKPIGINAGDLWTLRFGLNASFLLHIAVTLGLVGLMAAVLFLKALIPKRLDAVSISLMIGLAALLLLPPNIPILVAIAAIWILANPSEKYDRVWKLPKGPVAWGTAVVFLVLAGAALYFAGRAYGAELTFARSLVAAAQNKGTDTYNLQIKSIGQNPYIARFHLTYSRTNLALASAITQGPDTTTPRTLTDEERATVTQLIQQAIREAKLAVNLAPNNAFMWENLATVYQTLIGVANGAENWTVASLQRAIQLDPANPILRVNLGGVYVAQNMYDEAIQQFLIAANLKPDWANAYYNLAHAYRQSGATDKAITALEKTLTLVDPDTSDWAKANNELNDLKNTPVAKEEVKEPETLTNPPSGEPIVVPPLTLPDSSGPSELPTETPASPAGETPQPSL